jgi:hypothetical protein
LNNKGLATKNAPVASPACGPHFLALVRGRTVLGMRLLERLSLFAILRQISLPFFKDKSGR